jgi:hypothetical protein
MEEAINLRIGYVSEMSEKQRKIGERRKSGKAEIGWT